MTHSLTRVLFFLGCALSPAFAVENATAGERIYKCEIGGVVTYSDTGCVKSDRVEVTIEPLNTFEARVASPDTQKQNPVKKAEPPSNRDDSIALEQQRAKQRCQRLADRLETIQVKRRIGHTAEQGERLREQQRQLEQQRKTEKCR